MASEAPVLPATLGGQAVVEGVMIRGPRGSAVCVRKPDGEIVCRTEHAESPAQLRGVPVVRGVVTLGETLSQGMRALIWSAQIAAGREPEEPSSSEVRASSALSLGFVSAVFLLAPAIASRRLERATGKSRFSGVIESATRIGMLVGYLRAMGRIPEAQRLFGYHAAEHRAIQAFEANQPLDVETLGHFPNAHVRCGTSFLLTTTLISSVLYTALGPQPSLGRRLISRAVLMPVVAGLSYEAIRLGSTAGGVWKLLFQPNLALQSLTTRDPDGSQMEVAIAALKAAVALHQTP